MTRRQKLKNFCVGLLLVLGLFTGYKVLENDGLEQVSGYKDSIHQEVNVAQSGEDKTLFPIITPAVWANFL